MIKTIKTYQYIKTFEILSFNKRTSKSQFIVSWYFQTIFNILFKMWSTLFWIIALNYGTGTKHEWFKLSFFISEPAVSSVCITLSLIFKYIPITTALNRSNRISFCTSWRKMQQRKCIDSFSLTCEQMGS